MEKNYKCWPKGVFKQLSYPEVPVFQFLRSSALRWPWRNALIFGGMEITYPELDQLSDRFATALADLGVKKGDKVGIHLPNCTQFAIAYYGLLKAGAIFVPISPLLAERELVFECNDAKIKGPVPCGRDRPFSKIQELRRAGSILLAVPLGRDAS